MILLLAILAGNSSVALAQPGLQPLSYLVGHCWAGEAPGYAGQDKHCFESVYGGQHVRDRHSVIAAGKEVYAGETLYSVRGVKVIFTYWNSLGGLGTGNAEFNNDTWRFQGMIHATATDDQPFSAIWRRVADGYEVIDAPDKKPRLFKRAD